MSTPLLWGSNACSGIRLFGAVLGTCSNTRVLADVLVFMAGVLATINVVGGCLVTHRMLGMYRRKD